MVTVGIINLPPGNVHLVFVAVSAHIYDTIFFTSPCGRNNSGPFGG